MNSKLIAERPLAKAYDASRPDQERLVAGDLRGDEVLPAELAENRERVARLLRQAQVFASYNHPNIAAIYGLGNRVASWRGRWSW